MKIHEVTFLSRLYEVLSQEAESVGWVLSQLRLYEGTTEEDQMAELGINAATFRRLAAMRRPRRGTRETLDLLRIADYLQLPNRQKLVSLYKREATLRVLRAAIEIPAYQAADDASQVGQETEGNEEKK